MDNRRKFIKKAALGSVLMVGLPDLNHRVHAAGLSNPGAGVQESGA
ncbi:MAG: twin-arginine translocation signal domain-containing protein, partial [Prevotellaceae bacterium]|nr:twin-arginine translocation signal domain-containing protein [Prevotellaceae bacterium]